MRVPDTPPPRKHAIDKYGVGDILPGENKFIPLPKADQRKAQRAINQHAQRRKKKLAARTWVEDGIPGLRVWRTE